MKPGESRSADRSSDAYDEGRRSCANGLLMDDCPYPCDQARMDWFSGWLDQWSDVKHGELFRKYGVDGNAVNSGRQRRQHRRIP